MLLNALLSRETGRCSPRELELHQATHRSFNVDTCKLRDFASSHSGGVNALELEKVEGRYLLVGGGKGAVVIYDTWNSSGALEHQYQSVCKVPRQHEHKFSVETVQWYPFDNGLFTTSGGDKQLKIWDSNLLTPAETYSFSGIVYSHHMSPCATEHNLIAVGTSSSQAQLVDMRTGSSIHAIRRHSGPILCVRWSPCLPFVVTTGSQDGRVFSWDVRMGETPLVSLDQHNGQKSVGAAHTGQVLALEFVDTGFQLITYGGDDTVRLWDAFTGKNELVNYGKVFNDLLRGVKISISSGTYYPVLFIPEGGKIKCFDVQSGHMIKELNGHFGQVNCCHYNPFNQEMYSGSNDRNILVWTPDHSVEEAYLASSRDKSTAFAGTSSSGNATAISQSQSSVLADTWSDSDE